MHITQNVDGLLQAARMPTKRLVELHGSIHGLVCRRCGVRESREAFQIRLEEMNEVWARELGRYEHRPDGDADLKGDFIERFQVGGCTGCGEDALMPSLVFHGGGVPKDVSETCMDIVEGCDGLVVIGSTVTPYSAFRLVRKAKERGLFVGCVNFGDTRADGMYDCKVEGLVGNAVARLADMMLVGGYGDEEGFEGVLKADEDFVVRRLEL